ncbi:Rhs element Vgr protein, partial [Pseudomonas aeruginosa]|nr:Rhs element Vgr protein [Pseudomonas aeruginosa]
NHRIAIGGHLEQDVQGHAHLQAGQEILHRTRVYRIQAQDQIILQGPGGTLRIDASGITLDGIAITIKGPMTQSGGGGGNALALANQVLDGQEADCVERNR